ncbi:MAG: hypothetical protein ABIO79_01850 [Ferruginibacter sp.]
MPVKKQIPFTWGHFFITCTCYKWLQLIAITNGYDLFYNWFNILKANGHFITGYVIMPNHVHVTIAFRESKKSLNTIIGDGKRFMSYEIVKRITASRLVAILQQLKDGVNKTDRKRGNVHEVWEDSFDWKECCSHDFVNQKLDYMHNNPCIEKWNLSVNPYSYLHSSAKFYISGEQGIYPVTIFWSWGMWI